MSNHEDLRTELDALRAERDALLAERKRAAVLVAAAKAYAKALATSRAAFAEWDRSPAPAYGLVRAVGVSINNERDALFALVEAARALPTDGGSR